MRWEWGHRLFEGELGEIDIVLWGGDQVDQLTQLGLEGNLWGARPRNFSFFVSIYAELMFMIATRPNALLTSWKSSSRST